MKIEVLLSCMHQTDMAIIEKSNIQTDVVVVNQCDRTGIEETLFTDAFSGSACRSLFINTQERGLSRSRNMAIRHSTADICIIADDDEFFSLGYKDLILDAYEKYAHADVIVFQVKSPRKTYSQTPCKVGYREALHVSSYQITFRRKKIVENQITFDEEMGSGTGHGCGEENKFVFDCLHHHLRIQYVPVIIATIQEGSDSQWFHGFTADFFLQRGWATKRYLGRFMATLYAFFYAVKKWPKYRKNCTFLSALKNMLVGIYAKNPLSQ